MFWTSLRFFDMVLLAKNNIMLKGDTVMRNTKREVVFMGLGVLAGLALNGPAVQAADYLTARPSTQTFYINGQQAPLTAYLIGGSNYVRLRDIGQVVDFAVDYDAATNSVYISSDRPYQQEVTQPAQATSSPGITEESVQVSLAELRKVYPDGTVYPTPYRSTSNGPYSQGTHCSGWATLCSDAAFGNLPWRQINRPSWDQLRPGDLVEYKNADAYHVVVVLRKTDEFISVTESGNHNKALWGGQYFRWWLEEQPHYICYTRYPQ